MLFLAATLSALLDFCAVMSSWEAEQRGSGWIPPVDTSRGNEVGMDHQQDLAVFK